MVGKAGYEDLNTMALVLGWVQQIQFLCTLQISDRRLMTFKALTFNEGYMSIGKLYTASGS